MTAEPSATEIIPLEITMRLGWVTKLMTVISIQ